MTKPQHQLWRRLLLCGTIVCSLMAIRSSAADEIDYEQQVKPLLKQRCVRCHGPLKQESGLRLDAAQLIRKGGATGLPLISASVDESLLIGVVTGEAGFRMPPEGAPLSDEEIALLRRWVEQGAPAPEQEEPAADPRSHWAYRPPVRPIVPAAARAEWARNPVDAFISGRHLEFGLSPQAPAPRHVLLRRVYLDLIGLPPSPHQLQAFLQDNSPDAYCNVVERLLASPQYGERWARHWMDVWRYSDWYGYRDQLRNSARHIWRWRDWIVESLNEDKPYDRMIVEMLAADEVAPGDADALRATGFLARNYYIFNRNVWLDDTIEHTAKAFLGVTMNCARCHDHMYDPISQRDYYAFRAIFEPYKVRTDRLAGQPDTEKDGLALAYDAMLDEPTYLFERGNDKKPDKRNPVSPAVPAVLGTADFQIEPIELPTTMYYPGLQEFVRHETLEAARTDTNRKRDQSTGAQHKLESAKSKFEQLLASAKSSTAEQDATESVAAARAELESAQQRLIVAEKQAAAAEARLLAVEARIAADKATYSVPAADDVDSVALQADKAEREAAAAIAEAALAAARLELQQAQHTPGKDDAQKKQAVTEAREKLNQAQNKLDEAQAALAQPDGKYDPLTPVYPATSSGRRRALARWIVEESNPLAARVAVNHMWMRHFGRPLVSTVFDFGLNGKSPSHPRLLDWLAVEFMESGWSMKHMHRLMVFSNTYRMDSASTGHSNDNTAVDADNRLLWRMNSRRMESEVVRDSVLSVAGQLDFAMRGPELDSNLGATTCRRSLYYRHAPEKFMTFLQLFDGPSPNECYRRDETVVPQQALALANSPLSIEQSRRLARILSKQVGVSHDAQTAAAFIDALFLRVLCRLPNETERDTCRRFLDEQAGRLAQSDRLTEFETDAEVAVAPADDPHQRARENLAHVLINHNEFVTIR